MLKDSIMLEIQGLTKRFGGITAVNNVDLSISEGDIFGLIGPNGAGKTTILNMITGIYTPTSGTISFNGEDITGEKSHVICKKGIARTFQNIKLFNSLSVYDNVLTACHGQAKYGLLSGFIKTGKCRAEEKKMREQADYLLNSVGLMKYKDMHASNLPYGMQRRLEIARGLATKPKLILLDEPAAGMNESETMQLVEFIMNIKEQYNLTMIIIDHHMDVIMNACNLIAVLNFGERIALGSPEEIQNNHAVVEAYLGDDE